MPSVNTSIYFYLGLFLITVFFVLSLSLPYYRFIDKELYHRCFEGHNIVQFDLLFQQICIISNEFNGIHFRYWHFFFFGLFVSVYVHLIKYHGANVGLVFLVLFSHQMMGGYRQAIASWIIVYLVSLLFRFNDRLTVNKSFWLLLSSLFHFSSFTRCFCI